MRGDAAMGLGVLVGTVILGGVSAGGLGLIVNIILAFVYNKMYTTKKIEAGYQLEDAPEINQRARAALGIT